MLSHLPLFLTVICFLACVPDMHADWRAGSSLSKDIDTLGATAL
jgi:hypothetical protein